jgi:hypothetical protein
MNEDRVAFSTQHFGPAKQLTKYGQPFAPSGSAEMENCMEKTRKNTRESVRRIYHQSKDQVSEEDSNTLHAQPIKEVMKWMKRHLDAYLATAEVYLEQNIDPG